MKLLVHLSTLLVVLIFNFSQAKRLRKTLGGGMRQVGVLYVAAYIAMQENIGKLEDDHRKAKISLISPKRLYQVLQERGILTMPASSTRFDLGSCH